MQTALFQAIQFSTIHSLVLFDQLIRPYKLQILPARVDLGAKVLKVYFAFPKAPALLAPHHQIV